MASLRHVSDLLRSANLTAKPSKLGMAVLNALVTISRDNLLGPKMIKYRLTEMPFDLQLKNRSNHS